MRATRARGGTVGRWCESGWIDLERQSGTAAILELAARTEGASLDPAAAVGASEAAPLHHDRDLPQATVRDPAIETRAPLGTHTPLDAMAGLRVLFHGTNL